MKAWLCDDSRPVPTLRSGIVDIPQPGPDDVVIQVHCAGVTPSELQWYPTTHAAAGEDRSAAIPSHEFSGTVFQTAEQSPFQVGQDVFGMNDWFADGATAEYCVTKSSSIVLKPVGLSHADAASLPISALTAWQGLFDRANLQAGERVLIHGAAGGVGVLAVQLARWRGAEVIATASARSREFLMSLGVSKVIDYRNEQFDEAVGDVDVVFDGIGGSTLQRSWKLLGPTGRLITIAASSEVPPDERTRQAFFIVEPNSRQLSEIAGLIEADQLRAVVDAVVPFEHADRAYDGTYTPRRGAGKMVVQVGVVS